MAIPFKCDRCGTVFTPSVFKIANNVTLRMTNNRVRCPVPDCFGWGHHENGTYEFVDGVLKAFTANGFTRQNLVDARTIVKEVSASSITGDVAIQRLEAISADLAKAIAQSGQHKINWELILALIVLVYTVWTDRGSDEAAQAALKEAETQTAISQKILEATQELNKSVRELKPTPALRGPTLTQTNGAKNRRERRKQKAFENRSKPKPPTR